MRFAVPPRRLCPRPVTRRGKSTRASSISCRRTAPATTIAFASSGRSSTVTQGWRTGSALRDLGNHPPLSALFGSPVRYHSRTREWGVAVHLLKLVLYHRGQLDEQPRPSQPRWAYRPQLPAPMAAVIERYILARRLTDRP